MDGNVRLRPGRANQLRPARAADRREHAGVTDMPGIESEPPARRREVARAELDAGRAVNCPSRSKKLPTTPAPRFLSPIRDNWLLALGQSVRATPGYQKGKRVGRRPYNATAQRSLQATR